MVLTYTPYKGIDIKVQIASQGTNYIYTLSPGCTITRSISKQIDPIPIPGTDTEGVQQKLLYLGTMESDTIRIDAKVSTVDSKTPDGSASSPPYVPIHTLIGYYIKQTLTDQYDVIVWGSEVIGGRIKNIVVTQNPGEGSIVDLTINFVVGTPVSNVEEE